MNHRTLIRTFLIAAAGLGLNLGSALAQTVTLDSLLSEMTDRTAIARLPDPAFTCLQASSYDRKSVTPTDPDGWFANADYAQFIRVEEHDGRKEHVLMDASGAGAIVRFWSANPTGVVRVYLDGSTKPAIEAPLQDVLGGAWGKPWGLGEPLAGEQARGWNLYLPIPYAKGCKVTCDASNFYYQINYRRYADGTKVESWDGARTGEHRALIEKTRAELLAAEVVGSPKWKRDASDFTLAPGSETTITLPDGPAAVRAMELNLRGPAPDSTEDGSGVFVKAEFDGEASVWCPLSALASPGYRDRYRVGFQGMASGFWLMPYEKTGRVVLHNFGTTPVRGTVSLRGGDWKWDARSMHFHATWRREYPIHAKKAAGTIDWNYVDITGNGVYVGDTLTVMNPTKAWWGEGDEKIYVDGEKFPSHFGTGTEDYYSYAWSNPQTFRHPFHSQIRCDGEKKGTTWGVSTVTRVRALDGIPFAKSLKFDMEVWHWEECDMAYDAVTYFYARPGATTNRAISPEAAGKPFPEPPPIKISLKIPGAIEFEDLTPSAKSSPSLPVTMQDGFAEKLWSGDAHTWMQAQKVGEFVEYAIKAGDDRPRKLTIYATRSWDYAVVRFTVNGQRAGDDVDLFNAAGAAKREVAGTGPIVLGEFKPKDGVLRVRAEVVGKNVKSENTVHFFGLDCAVLDPPAK